MAPLVSGADGFIADMIRAGVKPRPRRSHHSLFPLFAVVFALAVSAQVVLSHTGNIERSSVDTSPSAIASSNYSWRVYYLNETARILQANGTMFSFSASDLPFAFSSIQFGDFRDDFVHSARYYGGCGILVNASGSAASISLAEANGKVVSLIPYLGQGLIVFSGERKSVSYPNATTSYYGTDQIALDWRNGTWSPNVGILVIHPANVSLASSVFCLMVFEPVGSTEIPEFEALPAILFSCLIVLFIIRRAGQRSTGALASPC